MRLKLKIMDIWDEWLAGERKQLNQFHNLQMFGKPILRPFDEENAVIL